ncbi:MAG TPA: collagen-like protein [Solirubrobacterales bacterium]|nr:collagen-like protein [Solirubrobacterales bacterium]
MSLLILALLVFLAFGSTASAAPPVAKDGKIYACYKAKGKGKGTLRLVRNGKVRCPRKWKKVSWYASGLPGPGLIAPRGPAGPKGDPGPQGEKGTAGNVVVENLESKVSELLNRVEALEGTVVSLCAQTELLNDQTTALGSTLGSLNTVLDTLLLGFSPIEVPTALPNFSCPN